MGTGFLNSTNMTCHIMEFMVFRFFFWKQQFIIIYRFIRMKDGIKWVLRYVQNNDSIVQYPACRVDKEQAGILCNAGKLNDMAIDSLCLLATRSDVRVSGYFWIRKTLRIQKFPRPHVSILNSNFPFHSYRDSISVHQLFVKRSLAHAKILSPIFFNNFVSLTKLSHQALFRSFNLFKASNSSIRDKMKL